MRKLIRAFLRLFPEDIGGIHRTEMEETFLDGYRASPSPLRFALRELWSLLRDGTWVRVSRWTEGRGRATGPQRGPGGPVGNGPDPRPAQARVFSSTGLDLRLAFRNMVRNPGLTSASVGMLGVGIGATVAMFSILEVAFLRALPYPEPEELVFGGATFRGEMNPECSFPDYLSHKEGTSAFETLAAVLPNLRRSTLAGGDLPERVGTQWVTPGFFRALDVDPALGRTFLPEEGEPTAPPVAVLSHDLWQRRFGGDPEVLGRALNLDGDPVTVVGVMPAGFRFMNDTDVWAPVRLGMFDTEGRRAHSWVAVGRLREGVSLGEAQAQLDVVSARLAEAYPESHTDKGFGVVPLGDGLAERYRPAILLLMGATTLLLLIACGNVAGLLTARATARRVELSVRAALGARRGDLLRQLLVESLLLAGLAGAVGTCLAFWIQRSILAALPMDLLGVRSLGLGGPMLLFALVASLGTALIFGTGPALAASAVGPSVGLKGGRSVTGGKAGVRVRAGLVVAQVALSVVLLTAAGLLLRSFVRLQAVDLGFPPENLITAGVSVGDRKYEDRPARTRFFQAVLEEVETMPGVQAASFVNMVPIRDRWTNWYVWPTGAPPDTQEGRVSTYSRVVMPGYFETMGIPLLRGRDHRLEDGGRARPYLIVNQSAAGALFPGEDPVGRGVTVFNGMREDDYEILGVVADFRITSVDRRPSPQMYYSHMDRPSPAMNLVVRVDREPSAVVGAVREALRDLDPDVPLEDVGTVEEIVAGSISTNRILSLATGLFAVTSLFLSLTGLYAVLAHYVGSRSREIGIRVACGASRWKVSELVLKRGVGLVASGLFLGLLGAGASARALQSQLYQVGPLDPGTFGFVAGGFLGVGALAALLPARRAGRLDPVRSMQVE